MDILEGIRTRKSIGKVKPDPIDKEQIEDLLALGTRAPNHHHTEPWRFFVMTGEGRQTLGDAYTEIALEKLETPTEEQKVAVAHAQQAKARRSPVVIAVAVSFGSEDEIEQKEDRAATHAAIQNILLGAHGLGLGAIWRTGAPAYHPRMKQAFGLGENEEMVGLIYIGKPDGQPEPKPRRPFSEVTRWLEN